MYILVTSRFICGSSLYLVYTLYISNRICFWIRIHAMQPAIETACRICAPQHTVHRVHTDLFGPKAGGPRPGSFPGGASAGRGRRRWGLRRPQLGFPGRLGCSGGCQWGWTARRRFRRRRYVVTGGWWNRWGFDAATMF